VPVDEGCAALGRAARGLAAAFGLAADLALVAVLFTVVLALVVVFFAAAVVRDLAAGFLAAVVLRAVVVRLVLRPAVAVLAGAGGLMAEMVLAALVSDSAAVASALVAVFIVFIAVFIACAEVVALLAASVILVAADDTFVAADDTRVAAAAGVTDDFVAVVDRDVAFVFGAVLRAEAVRLVVFFAGVAFFLAAPLFVRLVLAVERRAVERVNVFVGTDPSPRARSASGGSIPQLAKIYTPTGCQTVFVSRNVVIRMVPGSSVHAY
jgi:hypothetical protein